MAGKGSVEGCASCAKWMLIIFNILFSLLGVGMLAAGIYAYIQLSDYLNVLGDPRLNIPAILLIVFGCITFIVASIGCIGACKESPCMLFTFASIIAVLLVAEIAVGAVAFVNRGKLEEQLSKAADQTLESANNAEGIMASWNKVQKELKCCGFDGASDWTEAGQDVPDSCKIKQEEDKFFDKGCKDALIEKIESNIYVVGGVAIGFALIEILGIVFGCCVGCAARKGEYA